MPTIYNTLLLDATDTALLAYVESNFDHEQLRQIIYDTQEIYLPTVLGSALYEELKDQKRLGTLTTLNETLLYTKVRPALIMRVLADGVMVFTYKFRAKGVVTQSSDNATPASMNDLHFLVSEFVTKYNTFAQRITNYLLENETSYPLYTNAGSGVDTIHPTYNQNKTSWFIPDTYHDKRCCNDNNDIPM